MFPASILLVALLCGQVFGGEPRPSAGVFAAPAAVRSVFPASQPEPPLPFRMATVETPCRDVPATVIGTVGVPAADGSTIAVITDYGTARRLAAADGKSLVVFAGPEATSLAAKRHEHGEDAVYAIGDAKTFPAAGVYEYRAGDLVGGKLAAFGSPPAGTIATPQRPKAARYSCGAGGCFLIPE